MISRVYRNLVDWRDNEVLVYNLPSLLLPYTQREHFLRDLINLVNLTLIMGILIARNILRIIMVSVHYHYQKIWNGRGYKKREWGFYPLSTKLTINNIYRDSK